MRERTELTNEAIQKVAPSAFQGQAYEKQSQRYAFIPTIDVIDGMRNAGLIPVYASQSSSRIPGKEVFTKHIIRFQAKDSQLTRVGDSILESSVVNSHDGSSCYSVSMGIRRLICDNGATVSDAEVGSIRVRHVGNIVEQVVSATFEILEQGPKVISTVKLWQSITLDTEEQKAFAAAAFVLRFEEDSNIARAVDPTALLTPRRYLDRGNDLWTVFNRVQEALVRGKVRGFDHATGNRVSTRAVKGIDQDQKLNKALWTLGQELAKRKA